MKALKLLTVAACVIAMTACAGMRNTDPSTTPTGQDTGGASSSTYQGAGTGSTNPNPTDTTGTTMGTSTTPQPTSGVNSTNTPNTTANPGTTTPR